MTLSQQKKLSKHICRLLKVNEINFPIGRTPIGNLGLVFNTNNDDYTMMLDSIPLSTANSLEDENNIELKKMIEKYCFEPETPGFEWTGTLPAQNSVPMGTHVIVPSTGESYDVNEKGERVSPVKPAKVTKTKK